MVVGPPGTGKTDVAVQMVSNIYHNFPNQKTLLVTHSNHVRTPTSVMHGCKYPPLTASPIAHGSLCPRPTLEKRWASHICCGCCPMADQMAVTSRFLCTLSAHHVIVLFIVTRLDQALNDLFAKIMERDIDERHLLRLGRGEKELETDKDFSKWGRVNYALGRRLHLLDEVNALAKTFGVDDTDIAPTCEAAEHFWLHHVQSRTEAYLHAIGELKPGQELSVVLSAPAVEAGEDDTNAEAIAKIREEFPFKEYFGKAPGGIDAIFKGESRAADLEAVRGCIRHLQHMFDEIKTYRAFELLRTARQRGDYLLVKEAKIVAMTCTHAALTRSHLVEMGFKYDNIVMEESAQILEVETFIPMLMQNFDAVDGCRLKRIVLIGDHHQLPPVVKNMAFQKYGHLDQSLFARFVRLGVPSIQLNLQGRARPEIANLYNWRYERLGNLPAVEPETAEQAIAKEIQASGWVSGYTRANAGFKETFQFINVEDYEGRGETQPSPYFYQNLGEAEYVVATFMYMRLLGYPADRISILTTYNGQKHLIRDVIRARCAAYPQFGEPRRVTTVDRYQGQQNDYILLSLVKTKNVGHLRDVRRLVVAVSRSRLGLYIFGRQALFENCYELAPAFQQLLAKPAQLQLVGDENYPGTRLLSDEVAADQVVTVQDVKHMGTIVGALAYQQQQIMMEQASLVHLAKNDPDAVEAEAELETATAVAAEDEEMEGDGDKAGQAAAAMAVDEDAPTDDEA